MGVDKLPKNQGSEPAQPSSLVAGGEPPYDGGMESRIQRLEADVATIKADLAVVRSNYATKEDLADLTNSLIKWMIGTAIGLGVAAVTVVTFVLNNATPKANPAPAVIYIPYPSQPFGPPAPAPSSRK